MANWKDRLNGDPLPWLLEADPEQPGVRYFALRDILGGSESDKEMRGARKAVFAGGRIPRILAAQKPEGYWVKPGPGYSPKYTATVWQIIFMAQLGADISDPRVKSGCEYLINHTLCQNGWFSYNGSPSGFLHCHAGNVEAALIDLGYLDDARLQNAIEKHARFVTGEGIAPVSRKDAEERFYTYTCGPVFECGANGGKPCAWGAVKSP